MKKETRLDDSASIYEKRNSDQDAKQTWKELDRSGKWQFFKDYYLAKILVIVVTCCIVGRILFVMLGPKTQTVLYTAVIQDNLNQEKIVQMTNELKELYQVNKHQTVFFDTAFYGSQSDSALGMSEKLATLLYADQIDTIISNKAEYLMNARSGNLRNLDSFLPDDMKTALADKMVSVDIPESEDFEGGTFNMGIDLSNCVKYQNLEPLNNNPILSVSISTKNEENVIKFIRYLFDL